MLGKRRQILALKCPLMCESKSLPSLERGHQLLGQVKGMMISKNRGQVLTNLPAALDGRERWGKPREAGKRREQEQASYQRGIFPNPSTGKEEKTSIAVGDLDM